VKAPPVPALLVHGQPGSSADFELLRRLLSPSRTVLAPDRPGWGTSAESAGGFGYNADAMLRVLDDAGIDRALVVGYSWGGGVALACAEDHPERVAGLVLLSPVGPHSVRWVDRMPLLPGVGAALTAGGFVAARAVLLLVELAQRFGGDDGSAGRLRAHSLARSVARKRAAASFLIEQRALFSELDAIIARLGEVRAPTVVVSGDQDHLVPAATASALVKAIPSATLRIVPGAGHPLPVFAPEAAAAAVAEIDALAQRA
jgi:pimeloyl-ACP methyl ester carboxylesterase